jgi:hypothetical protein
MKQILKQKLSELGVLPKLDLIRYSPKIGRWLVNGCTGAAPPPVKRFVLASYLRRYQLSQFIETGTHLGDTLAYIAQNKTIECTSIELADHFYKKAEKRFASYSNVSLLHGDCGEILPQEIEKIEQPVLFWLDGHYSGLGTAKSTVDTPISIELMAILESTIKKHIILIDDARQFTGEKGYPCLDQLLESVRALGCYDAEVSTDIIRLTPKK